ncbi:putative ribosomal protein S5 domain 2-like protein [Lyophyllum shimeji]|uniref:Ribosomal protein S5 domain 2-like protein n=1 Tax=Lyophyllum shimeji TaxID=47721 RepID=A0A9P3PG79_LYOSH|nr:putative ribosomal protein S5 domain 2-like protein [Lyophyllum shimeji]
MAQTGFDRRRINGPEQSHPPTFGTQDEVEGRWIVGQPRKARKPMDIRPIFLQPGLIDQANGSAYVETERTKIACAVYGPRQTKSTAYHEKGKLNVEVKFTPFSCERRRAPMRDAEDRSLAVAIHQALLPAVQVELLPKSTIDIFLTIIEADGIEACVAAGTVAASTALADAGIEMIGLVMSCAAAVVEQETWLDPTEEEARSARGSLVLSCMPALGTVTSVWQSGKLRPEEVLGCMDACQERCSDIHSVVAQALLENA